MKRGKEALADALASKRKRGPRIRVAPPSERSIDGILFDSKKEMQRYRDLVMLQKLGQVLFFLRQVPFRLPGGVTYRVDFVIWWPDGRTTFEDVKGHKTEVYRLKKRLVEAHYPVKIIES